MRPCGGSKPEIDNTRWAAAAHSTPTSGRVPKPRKIAVPSQVAATWMAPQHWLSVAVGKTEFTIRQNAQAWDLAAWVARKRRYSWSFRRQPGRPFPNSHLCWATGSAVSLPQRTGHFINECSGHAVTCREME